MDYFQSQNSAAEITVYNKGVSVKRDILKVVSKCSEADSNLCGLHYF